MALNSPTIKRRLFQGVMNIIRFNWDYYLIASGWLVVGVLVLALIPLPDLARRLCLFFIAATGYYLFASLVASLWVYDLSTLYNWEWLTQFLCMQPHRALNVHSGFDETSLTLQRLFPETVWEIADFFDPAKQTEASIARARRAYPAAVPFTRVIPSKLPYDTGSFETVFLLFAVHEIRSRKEREQFFEELRRVLKPGGTVVLVEHLRDVANFAVYGPGAMHFYPKQEWDRLARHAGFCITKVERRTPFVSAFKIEL